jgi:hypothetical protein
MMRTHDQHRKSNYVMAKKLENLDILITYNYDEDIVVPNDLKADVKKALAALGYKVQNVDIEGV